MRKDSNLGCDAHLFIERYNVKKARWYLICEPDIGRNYELFGQLAGVRSPAMNQPIIVGGPRGVPEHMSVGTMSEYKKWNGKYGPGHSYTWFTLRELKAYRLIVRDLEPTDYLISLLPEEVLFPDNDRLVRFIIWFDS